MGIETLRILNRNFGPHNAPTALCVHKYRKKVQEIGILINNARYPHFCSILLIENISAAADNTHINPRSSTTRHRYQEVDICCTNLRRILHKDLGLLGFKIQLSKKLIFYGFWSSWRMLVILLKKIMKDIIG